MTTLFCVPYAGGTGLAYARLHRSAGPGLRLVGLDLPGRGQLRREPPATTVPAAVAALAAQVRLSLGSEPVRRYGVLGHSFGALLAHRLVAELAATEPESPARLVVSCCPPPHLLGQLDGSTDALLAAAARALRKTLPAGPAATEPAAVMAAGRLDLALLEGESPGEPPVVDVPVLGLYGTDDPFRPGETMGGWQRWTTAEFSLRPVPGGHFCFREHPAPYLEALHSTLATQTGSRG
ncbi:thioesterase II family protein [Streptomyces sp. 8N706]|uniref:thioesterase II family protein n=1 Tax=Streptomyces sp. 8N706 TaxID=3457416 RepID=UPI003FD1BC92